MGSGCGDSIVEKSFVHRANSPSRRHLTRCLLLCSQITIHDFTGNVNTHFIDIVKSIQDYCAGEKAGFCHTIYGPRSSVSRFFPTFSRYNGLSKTKEDA